MSVNIFEEVDYNTYLIEQYWDKFNSESVELKEAAYKYDFDSYQKYSTDEAIRIIKLIYEKNMHVLHKEPWSDLLFKRLIKDIKKGFVTLINIQPTLFQSTMRLLTPILKLFSKANIFTKVLNDTNMFYETKIGGCYDTTKNRIIIVIKYINLLHIDLDTLKTVLHEYCHYYSRKKHTLYVQIFEPLVVRFYKKLVSSICENFNLNLDSRTKQDLLDCILKNTFYQNIGKKSKEDIFKWMYELKDINEAFSNAYINMLLSRITYDSSSDAFVNANVIIKDAYRAISDDITAAHIFKFDFSYQEFFCADEVIAIMSYYKPNYKPYLQMLESLV